MYRFYVEIALGAAIWMSLSAQPVRPARTTVNAKPSTRKKPTLTRPTNGAGRYVAAPSHNGDSRRRIWAAADSRLLARDHGRCANISD